MTAVNFYHMYHGSDKIYVYNITLLEFLLLPTNIVFRFVILLETIRYVLLF